MAITIRQQLAPFWFKLEESQADSAEFHVRPLNQMQLLEVRRCMHINERDMPEVDIRGVDTALQHGLIAWRNVTDESGKPLPISRDAIARMDMDVLNRLVWEIINASLILPEQKKS